LTDWIRNCHGPVVFLERLQSYRPLPSPHISHLGSLYRLSTTPNAEIRLRFYNVALADSSSASAQSFAPEAAKWVVGKDESGVVKGRMKFCRPVFRAVHRVNKELAFATYEKSKEAFHPIARKLIEKVLFNMLYVYDTLLTFLC
jgi:leukotriene-A4 hydrolase